jgi:hypothetical protein
MTAIVCGIPSILLFLADLLVALSIRIYQAISVVSSGPSKGDSEVTENRG